MHIVRDYLTQDYRWYTAVVSLPNGYLWVRDETEEEFLTLGFWTLEQLPARDGRVGWVEDNILIDGLRHNRSIVVWSDGSFEVRND